MHKENGIPNFTNHTKGLIPPQLTAAEYKDKTPAERIECNVHVITGFMKLMMVQNKHFDESEGPVSVNGFSVFDYLSREEAHEIGYAMSIRKWRILDDVKILSESKTDKK